ncbi:LytR family transcriptional attenuator [Kribbella orskensis]|uniref:LytR family transcriptional attenuator n=1 Tax=Kribbella orskensis TaxID=2512216 RepID=A0ABY2B905_9ACTN|nr:MULTISPECIES: LCP family protein [Kribbella]TCN31583.1 LytR family transcriptional attenuator [Kribbella sp. VKM Ac-2500]TCO11928.1 LytR family transcriptional attenuator [Kribbella orskensis]
MGRRSRAKRADSASSRVSDQASDTASDASDTSDVPAGDDVPPSDDAPPSSDAAEQVRDRLEPAPSEAHPSEAPPSEAPASGALVSSPVSNPAGRPVNRSLPRSLWLTLFGALLPGLGLVIGGRKRLGAFVLTLWIGLVGLVVYVALTRREEVLAAAVVPRWLLAASVLIGAVALLWIMVIVGSHRLLRPATVGRGARFTGALLVGALTFAIAAPAALAVQSVLAQLDLVQNVFVAQDESKSATRPSTVNVKDPWEDRPRLNLLLLGGDDGPRRIGVRADTVIVASIDTKTGDTSLISMPRQLTFMPFPKDSPLRRFYPDGFGQEGLSLEGRLEWMLTAMYQNIPEAHPGILGPSDNEGADVVKQSVGEATGLKIDYYLQVNLQGFDDIVDALGGITVNVNERVAMGGISSSHIPPGQWIEPGPNQHLNGFRALWFARGRYGADDDQRQIRQRCAIKGIVDAADPATLATKYQAIAKAGKNLLRTDIPQELLPALIQLAFKVKSANVSNVALDVSKLRLKYLHPDYEGLRETVEKALSAKPEPPSAAAGAGPTPGKSTPPGKNTSPGKPATSGKATPPAPTENLQDACAYHPTTDQPDG